MQKIVFFLLISLTILTLLTPAALAISSDESDIQFNDLNRDHWSYESVMNMVKMGIMEGESKNRFNPTGKVTRGEFAILMVKVLDLPLVNPEQGTFLDIPRNSKYYKYVETAKYYLTGYRTSQGDYFRPEEASVREDIAVSLVKALGYQPINNFLAILNDYRDLEEISPNLRSYVASIVDNEIMVGTGSNDKKMFNPQTILTRAEVAKLLNNILTAEKVTYEDGDKVTYEPEDTEPTVIPSPTPTPASVPESSYTPQITVAVTDKGLKVDWSKTAEGEFNYYKVVLSKSDSSPAYPENGYVAVLSDINETEFVIKPGQGYNGGDLSKVAAGEKYYISVTAVYKHGKYTSNVIYKKMPD